MTARTDAIIEKAYKYLDRFYENHGEEIPKRKTSTSQTREKVTFDDSTFEETLIHNELKKKDPAHCKRPGCMEIPRKGNRFCDLHFKPKSKSQPIKIFSPKPVTKSKPQPFSIETWTPPRQSTTPTPVDEKLSLNIKGLNSREIVELIKKETGEAITICLKSKQNVIRHARLILKKKGMKLYE